MDPPRPHPDWPLVVAYGLGVNSAAILVEFAKRGIRPDRILLADTGGEKPETYSYLPVIQQYLQEVKFPPVVTVRYEPKTAPDRALEGQCLHTGTLPSLAYGGKSRSLKWKRQPQDTSILRHFPPGGVEGNRVVRAIGVDATEERRTYAGVVKAVGLDAGENHRLTWAGRKPGDGGRRPSREDRLDRSFAWADFLDALDRPPLFADCPRPASHTGGVMDPNDLLKMLDLGGRPPDRAAEAGVVGPAPAGGEPPADASPTALEIDARRLRRGRDLVAESERLRKRGADEFAADFFACGFDPDPRLAETCADPRRQRFVAQLLDTPEYRALHADTPRRHRRRDRPGLAPGLLRPEPVHPVGEVGVEPPLDGARGDGQVGGDVLVRPTPVCHQDDLNPVPQLRVGGGTEHLFETAHSGVGQLNADHDKVPRRGRRTRWTNRTASPGT